MVEPKRTIYSTLTTGSNAATLVFANTKAPGQSYGCSDEQIFSPVQISQSNWWWDESSGWISGPSFKTPWSQSWGESGDFGSGSVGPTISELNPYYSNTLDNFFDGLDFVQTVNNSSEKDLDLRKLSSSPSTVYTTGLRGPLILSGWGYDIVDRPVPSEDGDEHLTDMQGDRSTWKSGPVNLQWDEERQVWQGGPQIVCGTVVGAIRAPTGPCNPTSFTVRLLRLQGTNSTYGTVAAKKLSSGNNNWWGSGCEEITVLNRDPSLEEVANDGMIFCIAVRINYEWLPIWVGCPDAGEKGSTYCTNC